jgi:hypothetical protein
LGQAAIVARNQANGNGRLAAFKAFWWARTYLGLLLGLLVRVGVHVHLYVRVSQAVEVGGEKVARL